MRKELRCPLIQRGTETIGYGGNQEWFLGSFQRLAGCGSVTGSNIAAIYAEARPEMRALYQPEQGAHTYESYLKLMETMYGYMKPGFMGYPLIGRFAKDFKAYAADRGVILQSDSLFLPKEKNKALEFIFEGMLNQHPVAF